MTRLKWNANQHCLTDEDDIALGRFLAKPKKRFHKRTKNRNPNIKITRIRGGRKHLDYGDYIHSRDWQRRRTTKLDSVGRACEECGRTWELTVHHLHYRTFGNERNEDLQVLCRPCHRKKHPSNEQGRQP